VALIAGGAWFVLVFALGFLLGPLRILLLEPRLGATGAVLVEAVPMLLAMVLLAPWVARLFAVPPRPAARLAMGGAGLLLLVLAETLLGALILGRTPAFWVTRATTPDGQIYLALLAAFALMPLLRRHA
jgi:hypothetical protein